MVIFKNIRFLRQVQLLSSILFTIIFLISAALIYYERRKNIRDEVQLRMDRELKELSGIVNVYLKRDKDILSLAMEVAENKINETGDFEESENQDIEINAVDPYSNLPIQVKIKDWMVDGSSILNNYSLVDQINKLTKVDVSIYQKCDKGFVNVSTSLLNLSEERMVGDIILNSSKISKNIEQGNQFSGRVYQRKSWYEASYKPIYINGKVRGLYYLGIKERLGRALKDIFESRVYFKTGYPFLITQQGNSIIHPDRQGEDLSSSLLYKKIIASGLMNSTISYKWPENEDGIWWNLHFTYHTETQSYICISYPKNEVSSDLVLTFIYIFIGFLIFIIGLVVILFFTHHSLKENLRFLKLALNQISTGHRPQELRLEGVKDFIELSDSVNQIALRFKELTGFANGLANDNYTQQYPKSLIDDEIGEALIKINDKLNEAMYNEHIRLKEEKLRSWETEGLSKFVYILQRNRENLDELCYELIMNLVQYLNANLGALFFINFDNPNDIYFEQLATFAFEKKRLIHKKIYPDEGLIGRIYNEKQTIYLSEIPEGYINISTGLGESIPKNLLIVPLLINKEVYGAIEIASFNTIKGFQIEFIEKIGENIASTINNVLVNSKTKELLKQSWAQSELLSKQEEEMRKNLQELKNIQKESDAGLYEKREIFKSLEPLLLLIELDSTGIILSVNDKVPAFFAMDKSNLIGKHFSDYSYFIPVDEYKNLIKNWESLMDGSQVQLELKVKSGFNKMVNVLVIMLPEFDKEQLTKIIIMGVEINSN